MPHKWAQLDHANVFARPIDYRGLNREPGADWALPERLAFMKPEAFAWQDEFRVVIGNKGALGAVKTQGLVIAWLRWRNGVFQVDGGWEYNLVLAAVGLLFFGFGSGRAGLDALFRRRGPDAEYRTIDDNAPA